MTISGILSQYVFLHLTPFWSNYYWCLPFVDFPIEHIMPVIADSNDKLGAIHANSQNIMCWLSSRFNVILCQQQRLWRVFIYLHRLTLAFVTEPKSCVLPQMVLCVLLTRVCTFVFFDFSLTVKAAPHECVIRTGQH